MKPPYKPVVGMPADPRDVYEDLAYHSAVAYDAYKAACDRGDDAAAAQALAEHNAYFMAAQVVRPMAEGD